MPTVTKLRRARPSPSTSVENQHFFPLEPPLDYDIPTTTQSHLLCPSCLRLAVSWTFPPLRDQGRLDSSLFSSCCASGPRGLVDDAVGVLHLCGSTVSQGLLLDGLVRQLPVLSLLTAITIEARHHLYQWTLPVQRISLSSVPF